MFINMFVWILFVSTQFRTSEVNINIRNYTSMGMLVMSDY